MRERGGVTAYGMYTTDPVYMYGQKGETVGGRVGTRLGGLTAHALKSLEI